MLESMKKVEAARAANTEFEPRRMTAEEKETLLATYHPDYKQSEFEVLEIGVNKGEKVPTIPTIPDSPNSATSTASMYATKRISNPTACIRGTVFPILPTGKLLMLTAQKEW